MNRHRFVGEWLALLKSNVTFWPYLIWLHHASQVGVRAGTMERTSPLALPGPTTPKTSARWPKVNCPKMAPARQAVLVAATEALQWSLANYLGMPWLPMAAKFLWWPATKAETPPQNWFSMISCSSSRVSTGSCRNCETVIVSSRCWLLGSDVEERNQLKILKATHYRPNSCNACYIHKIYQQNLETSKLPTQRIKQFGKWVQSPTYNL